MLHYSVSALIVHIGLIDITTRSETFTKRTTKQIVHLNLGTCRHVHNRTTGEARMIATTVCSANLSSHQIDDGRLFIQVYLRIIRCNLYALHTKSAPGTSSKHLHGFKVVHVFRDIDEHVAAILHPVAVEVARITLTTTIYIVYSVLLVWILQQVAAGRTEVNEGVIQIRLVF